MKEIQQLRSIVDALETDSKDISQFKELYKKLESSLTQLEAARANIEQATKANERFVNQSQERFIDILKSLNELKDTTIELQKLKSVISSEVSTLESSLTTKSAEANSRLRSQISEQMETILAHQKKSHAQISKLLATALTISGISLVGIVIALVQFFK